MFLSTVLFIFIQMCVVHEMKISSTNGKFFLSWIRLKGFQSKIVCSEGTAVQAHLLLMTAGICWSWSLSRDGLLWARLLHQWAGKADKATQTMNRVQIHLFPRCMRCQENEEPQLKTWRRFNQIILNNCFAQNGFHWEQHSGCVLVASTYSHNKAVKMELDWEVYLMWCDRACTERCQITLTNSVWTWRKKSWSFHNQLWVQHQFMREFPSLFLLNFGIYPSQKEKWTVSGMIMDAANWTWLLIRGCGFCSGSMGPS